MSCSGFLIQRLGLCLREEATSYVYVAVLHSNRTLLQRDVRTENELQWLSDSETWSPFQRRSYFLHVCCCASQ